MKKFLRPEGKEWWFILLLAIPLGFFGPYVEGYLWPVNTDFVVGKIDRVSPGYEVTGVMTKHRDCDIRHIDFELPRKGSRAVYFRPSPDDGRRPVGTFRVGPWLFGVDQPEDLWAIKAQFIHRCHPLWLTRTPVHLVQKEKNPS